MTLVKCGDVVALVLFVFTKFLGQQSYEDRYKEVEDDILSNTKKHESYLGIDYEEFQNFNIIESGNEEDAEEFSMYHTCCIKNHCKLAEKNIELQPKFKYF